MLPQNTAFPLVVESDFKVEWTYGLTKRELFAAMAMQGYNAQGHPNMGRQDKIGESLADADALLAALEGKGE